ncbi:glycosyltransferase family 9 protein [Allostreptomyces psammosilenae]|uniref:ADP-heptose:LPS heptosyltransferase n=1 Tax=Allostreptomyces psammosilenae TaxID=1892865 RepID=A0A852ZRK4_9ACTN|nr:glycosyltransferase family 9 protein [Allostreptomyces psammosilenae]NYI04107.1 ADP-heptose:LPS heptosyltransferase [Allostreptomyces psammosilenae]
MSRPAPARRRHVLAVRLDALGDVLLAGPALRALAAGADRLTVLAGPDGAAAARLLPGVDAVLTWHCPWIAAEPPGVDPADVAALVDRIRALAVDEAVVFTSFHQSPLPTALLLRLAGVPRISAISADYPGALLDVRHRVDDDLPEPERARSLAEAAGFPVPDGDDGRLRVAGPLPDTTHLTGGDGHVVVHPGASAPARRWPAERCAEAVRALTAAGHRVVVTGAPGETALTARVAGRYGTDLGGRTPLPELASVLASAAAVVAPNTGPAHLAAAVGTPVVSLYAPVVPAVRWAPYGVPVVLLGDQRAPCADTRARVCPVPGHPCLATVTAEDVVRAVARLAGPGDATATATAPTTTQPPLPARELPAQEGSAA